MRLRPRRQWYSENNQHGTQLTTKIFNTVLGITSSFVCVNNLFDSCYQNDLLFVVTLLTVPNG